MTSEEKEIFKRAKERLSKYPLKVKGCLGVQARSQDKKDVEGALDKQEYLKESARKAN